MNDANLSLNGTLDKLLSILDDDVLEGHDRSAILAHFKKGSFFTESYIEPEDGLVGVAFKKYVLNR